MLMKTVEMNEQSWKNHWDILTKLLLSHLLIAKAYQTICGVFQKYAERFHRKFAIVAMFIIFHVKHAIVALPEPSI